MDKVIQELVQQIHDLNKNLPKEFEGVTSTNLFTSKDFPDIQIQITVGYNLDEGNEND